MIITTRTFTRPSVDIPWHYEALRGPILFATRLEEDFMKTNKILSRNIEISDNELNLIVIIYWSTEQDMNSHFNDPLNLEYFKERDEYNKSVNIVMSDLEIESI